MRVVDRAVSSLLSAVGQAVAIYFLASRLLDSPIRSRAHARLSLLARMSKYSAANWLLCAAFFTTWAFFVMVANIEVGGSYSSPKVCDIAYYCVVSFYAVTKFFTYTFLVERAHIVRGGERKQDKLYWLNCIVLLGFVALAVSPLIITSTEIRDGKCHLGVAHAITITLVAYDVFASTFWALQFLLPILKVSTFRSPAFDISSTGQRALRSLALRTFIATSATCIVTAVNVIHEIIYNEKEEAWIPLLTFAIECLLCCIILHYSTTGKRTQTIDKESFPSASRCHCSTLERHNDTGTSKADQDAELHCEVSQVQPAVFNLENHSEQDVKLT